MNALSEAAKALEETFQGRILCGVPFSEHLQHATVLTRPKSLLRRMNLSQADRIASFIRFVNNVYGPRLNNSYLVFVPKQCVISRNADLSCNQLKSPAVLQQLYQLLAEMEPKWWVMRDGTARLPDTVQLSLCPIHYIAVCLHPFVAVTVNPM